MEAFCGFRASRMRPRIRPRMRPNVPGCVPGCGSTSLNSGTTYLDLGTTSLNSGTTYLDSGTTSLNSGTTYLDSGTTYLDASQDTSQTSLDASLDPDTVSIPRFYRGGLVEAPKVKASFGTHPGTWGRIQGRGDTRQGRRKASIIGHRRTARRDKIFCLARDDNAAGRQHGGATPTHIYA